VRNDTLAWGAYSVTPKLALKLCDFGSDLVDSDQIFTHVKQNAPWHETYGLSVPVSTSKQQSLDPYGRHGMGWQHWQHMSWFCDLKLGDFGSDFVASAQNRPWLET
jgi:hypothetical protein